MGETRITNAQDCGSKLEALKQRAKAVLPAGTIRVYDLMPVFEDAVLFAEITRALAEPFAGRVDVVVAPEALGWVLGAALARELGVGFVGVRKKGKLPTRPIGLCRNTLPITTGPKPCSCAATRLCRANGCCLPTNGLKPALRPRRCCVY